MARPSQRESERNGAEDGRTRGKTVHGEPANAGHRVLAPDDAEVEAYLETALKAPSPDRSADDRPAGADTTAPGTVAVLDFGSQFAQLIARRVRELDVYSELLPHDTSIEELERRGTRAIILSGGPMSVYDPDAPRPDPAIWSGRIPVLGICYGAQMMARELGGDVLPADRREYGPANVTITSDDGLFAGIDREQPVWMSHGDSITRLPDGFHATAQTDSTPYAGLAAPDRNLYGIQFHPEVVHTPRGRQVLRNFVEGIAGIAPTWTATNFIDTTVAGIRERVDSACPRDWFRRPRHLRPVGWRGLGRRGGARPSRGRRSPDVHLCRPRPDAQEGIGAAARHVRTGPRDAPGHGRCARALPRPPRRRGGPGAASAGSSVTSSSASSRSRPPISAGSTS